VGLPLSEAADFASAMVRQGLLFTVPACLGLGILSPVLFPLVYGQQYAASVAPFLLLLPCVLFVTVDGVIGRFFNATNNHMPLVITRTVSAALNLGLNFWWVPGYGIEGAAAAACTSFALQAILAVTVFLLLTEAKLRDLVVMRFSDVEPYLVWARRLVARIRPNGGP
jgi:O-antigen/teichoic acid export membrane protein